MTRDDSAIAAGGTLVMAPMGRNAGDTTAVEHVDAASNSSLPQDRIPVGEGECYVTLLIQTHSGLGKGRHTEGGQLWVGLWASGFRP